MYNFKVINREKTISQNKLKSISELNSEIDSSLNTQKSYSSFLMPNNTIFDRKHLENSSYDIDEYLPEKQFLKADTFDSKSLTSNSNIDLHNLHASSDQKLIFQHLINYSDYMTKNFVNNEQYQAKMTKTEEKDKISTDLESLMRDNRNSLTITDSSIDLKHQKECNRKNESDDSHIPSLSEKQKEEIMSFLKKNYPSIDSSIHPNNIKSSDFAYFVSQILFNLFEKTPFRMIINVNLFTY